MSTRPARYALLAGVLLTSAVVVLDAATSRATLPETLRTAGASVTGPVLAAIAGTFPDPPEHDLELTELSARLALAESEVRTARGNAALAGAEHIVLAGGEHHQIVLARVVAVGAVGPSGPERLTLDVGTDNGVSLDQSVVAAGGLVGRTVRVGATTSDVLIIGAADLVMGARGEDSGLLGTVSPAKAADPGPRRPGQLTFEAISLGELTVGEQVRTLGSPDNLPFVEGLPIGTVTSIDPARGRVGITAAITPAIDIAHLDVVAVIVPEGR